MINFCPFCGFRFKHPIDNCITTCDNCGRVFDTSPENRLLSASWACRKNHIDYIEVIKDVYKLSDEQAVFIQKYVIDGCYSHDELVKLIKNVNN